jgi:hypothetical protein
MQLNVIVPDGYRISPTPGHLYHNSIIIETVDGKKIGEVFRDEDHFWNCIHYEVDYGIDFLDSKNEAIGELVQLHIEEFCTDY